jgi:hypothetical protein
MLPNDPHEVAQSAPYTEKDLVVLITLGEQFKEMFNLPAWKNFKEDLELKIHLLNQRRDAVKEGQFSKWLQLGVERDTILGVLRLAAEKVAAADRARERLRELKEQSSARQTSR